MWCSGLAFQYVKEAETEILIPRSYGESLVRAKAGGGGSGTKWDPQSFQDAVTTIAPGQRSVIERLMKHGERFGSHPWWGVGQTPGMSWYYSIDGAKVSLFQIYLRPQGPAVAPSIGGLASAAGLGPPSAMQMLTGLQAIPAIAPHVAHVNEHQLNRYPSVPVEGVLDQPGVLEAFLGVVDDVRLRPAT